MEILGTSHVTYLDLSDNGLRVVHLKHFQAATHLNVLLLAGNPLRQMFTDATYSTDVLPNLKVLDASRVNVAAINISDLTIFIHLHSLNISNTRLAAVMHSGFQAFSNLRVLDLRGCPMTHIASTIFLGLADLRTVYSESYKLCCPDILPVGFSLPNCHAPISEVSSCDSLLKSSVYRVFMALSGALTLIGNLACIIYRYIANRKKEKSIFGVYISHLHLSDFFMGVYPSIISVADRWYLDNYLWNDITWRLSVGCKTAGFLAFMSTEVSALVMGFITLDRFLAIHFPRYIQWRANASTVNTLCVFAWAFGLVLASIPLLPMTLHWQFYGETGVCVPVLILRRDSVSHAYSFGILTVFNFVLFLLIGVGQMSIYWSVRGKQTEFIVYSHRSDDLDMARRTVSLAMTNCLCWIPVCLLGFLAELGTPVSDRITVAFAICVLPLSSAIHPCLYSLNIALERRRKAREEHFRKMLISRLDSSKRHPAQQS